MNVTSGTLGFVVDTWLSASHRCTGWPRNWSSLCLHNRISFVDCSFRIDVATESIWMPYLHGRWLDLSRSPRAIRWCRHYLRLWICPPIWWWRCTLVGVSAVS